jgi:pimeloyl-ACP methyl ester carboxylesterase
MTKSIVRTLPSGARIALVAAIISAALATAVKLMTRKVESANPPTGKFIEVDGVCLHYRVHGDGPPVVLLHGNGTMLQDFELSGIPALASGRYRTIIFDRAGFGHSDRPRGTIWGPRAQASILHKALKRLGIDRPVVAGHSWGTQVALALALDFPADVRSVVLLSGYYFPTIRLDAIFLSMPALPVIGDLMRNTISPWLGRMMWPRMLKKMFEPDTVPARFAAFPVWMSLRPSQLRAAAAESALMIPDALALCSRYGELTMPVFIVAGAGDRIVKTDQATRLHNAIPQSVLHIVPNAGHMVHHVVPDMIMQVIDAAATDAPVARDVSSRSEVPHAPFH